MFNFGIHNYRSFINEQFNFSRVNILIGENSSGKSSLIKFLLLLKQSLNNPQENTISLSGDLVDVGNYKETVYYHKERNNISFHFEFGDEYANYFNYLAFGGARESKPEDQKTQEQVNAHLENAIKSKTKVSIKVSKELNLHTSLRTKIENPELGHIEIIIIDEPNKPLISEEPKCKLKYYRIKSNEYIEIDDIGYSKKAFLSLVHGSDLNRKGLGMKYFEVAFLLITQNFIESHLNQINFINPLNNSPKRFYFKTDTKSSYKNIDFEKFIGLINSKNLAPDFLDRFQDIVSNFGIADEIKVLGDKSLPVLELRVRIKDLLSNIFDVGYGVSLQLPILFEALNSEINYGNTLIIEQPEVHLHPKLQSKFIETLVAIGSNNNYIIETHSEHIIRMLQVMVKDKKYNLNQNDVSIYYFRRENKKSVITKHLIDENGVLSPIFPPGFFDASYTLAKQLLY